MSPESRFKRWEETREKGLLRFILVRGILLWGLPIGIAFAAYDYFVKNDILGLTIKLPIWMLSGVLYGWVLWKVTNKAYTKYLATKG